MPVNAREIGRVDTDNAIGPIGILIQLKEENRDNLTEAKRHDSKVVATQAERRHSKDDCPESGDEGRNNDHGPEKPRPDLRIDHNASHHSKLRRADQPPGIGTYGKEGNIAEIKQAREANHDIEAKRENHIEARIP